MSRLLDHLARLVGFDTRNPPRDPAGIAKLYQFVGEVLGAAGFAVVEDRELGEGCRWLLLERGAAHGQPMVNVHVDTVPLDAPWETDPFALELAGAAGGAPHRDPPGTVEAEAPRTRAIGLGACDIKGALAAYLAAAEETRGAGALLLTSDEEAGQSRCVRTFCAEHPLANLDVMVAEPTGCRAVCVHRGIGTCVGTFRGTGGHASRAAALTDSANHLAVRWAARALDLAASRPELRFNLGTLEGGVKTNMIAASCKVRFGVRPAFGLDSHAALDELCSLSREPERVQWVKGYVAPPLPATGRRSDDAERLVASLGLALGDPVDFFTEAALFSEAGGRAFVFGPGDIAQAHTAGEWVAVDQLEEAKRVYARLLGGAS